MRSLINDVLTLSRLDESALDANAAVPVELHAVALRVAGRLESFASDHGVAVQVEGGAAVICGNETLAEEMLYNLVENGIRYNHPSGQVVVAVREEEGTHAAGEAGAAGGGAAAGAAAGTAARQVVVRVSDTGPGVPAELRDKIFERFFRVDKSRSKETGGTGLGLAIVKHAVLAHGGTIEVEGREGEGTTFVLRFPPAP